MNFHDAMNFLDALNVQKWEHFSGSPSLFSQNREMSHPVTWQLRWSKLMLTEKCVNLQ